MILVVAQRIFQGLGGGIDRKRTWFLGLFIYFKTRCLENVVFPGYIKVFHKTDKLVNKPTATKSIYSA